MYSCTSDIGGKSAESSPAQISNFKHERAQMRLAMLSYEESACGRESDTAIQQTRMRTEQEVLELWRGELRVEAAHNRD